MIEGLKDLNAVDLTRLVFHIVKIIDFNTGSKMITELWNHLKNEKEEISDDQPVQKKGRGNTKTNPQQKPLQHQ